jgi:AcrR family transcriptional regulator
MGKAKVTREQWLDRGLEEFGREGLRGLNIEAMAARLGSSKAGFYWYFKTRDAFLSELFSYWHEQETTKFIRQASESAQPLERLRKLFLLAAENRIYRDVLFQVRRLSAERRELRSFLDQIERDRIAFAVGVFKDLGFPADLAGELGDFLYSFYLGWYERTKHKEITRAEMSQLFGRVTRLMGLEVKGVNS